MSFLFTLLGCAAPETQGSPSITVLAASSLTEAMSAQARAWSAAGHGEVKTSFDGSSRLAKQVEAGIPADLFVSADAAWMDTLQEKNLIRWETRRVLLGNTLVLVVPADAAWVPADPTALAEPALKHLALAGEAVPAGRYARQALAPQWEDLAPRVVEADDVRGALAWVALGEAEAGVVYATDATADPRVKVAFSFPEGSHAPITYVGAVLSASTHPEEAKAFLDSCAGAQPFREAGFSFP